MFCFFVVLAFFAVFRFVVSCCGFVFVFCDVVGVVVFVVFVVAVVVVIVTVIDVVVTLRKTLEKPINNLKCSWHI